MLDTTNPKTLAITNQLEELYFLRDVVTPWMRENPHRVNFNAFGTYCGTYACYLGWYAAMRGDRAAVFAAPSNEQIARMDWHAEQLLGGDEHKAVFTVLGAGAVHVTLWAALFGWVSLGTLDERAAVLDAYIAVVERRLADIS